MNIPDELSPLLFPVADLHELPGNPRRGDVEAVRRSYEAFGQRKPIVARKDADGRCVVVAGNHQLKAARELGWEQIAVVWADDLTDNEAKAFALADNRVADLGTYDQKLLAEALDHLVESNEALLSAAGWSQQAVDAVAFDFDLPDDLGDYAPIEISPKEKLERWEALGVVGINFPIPADEHDELVRQLFALRKAYGLETNSETFIRLVKDAFATLDG